MDKKYWPSEVSLQHHFGIKQEYRAQLAWELIRSHPNICGVEAGEDSTGRAKLRLQSPKEVVERSFAIADLFLATAIERGDIQEVSITPEEQAEKLGELAKIQSDRQYSFTREKTNA